MSYDSGIQGYFQTSSKVNSYGIATNQIVILDPGTSTLVLPENPNRIHALIINNGDSPATIRLDADLATIDEGIPLMGKGAYYEITYSNLYVGEINAISAAGTNLSIVEGSTEVL